MIRLLELPARVASAVADVTIGTAIVLVHVARANRERERDHRFDTAAGDTMNSTRRSFARPSAVAFDATGSSSPRPTA